MKKIVVSALPSTREMEEHLQSLVEERKSVFLGALDLDVSHIDMRAQVYGVRITAVDMNESTIGVSYEADYNIYHGCKDQDVDGSQEGFATGVRTQDGWLFEAFVPPPKRTTLDEF